jgi:hypothetical protein
MGVHHSTVNFENFIRDLAEMYPFDVAEVVVVELIANCLDAKATIITVDFDASRRILVVQDNGRGMTAAEFEQYHDFAAGLKFRGTGIGFAGVGAKVSFNIADVVITETRGNSFCGASRWYLQSKKHLVWEDIKPSVGVQGTRVEVQFRSLAKIPYSSDTDLLAILKRHYLPLLDPKFLSLFYEKLHWYRSSLCFVVNGHEIKPCHIVPELIAEKTRELYPKIGNKRIGYGILGLAPQEYPLGPDMCGLVLCTHGKTIKPELFNQFPGPLGPRIFGVVEVPDFVKFLTTSKTDFVRSGRHIAFERLYGPVREEFKHWLREIGVDSREVTDTEEAAKLERELRKISEDMPELSQFFGFHTQTRIFEPSASGSESVILEEGAETTFPVGGGGGRGFTGPLGPGNGPGESALPDANGTSRARPISRKGRRGPRIGFAAASQRPELAWVDGNTVTINTAHACYIKAKSNSAARRVHNIYAIGTAIQRFLASGSDKPDLLFVDRLMSAWASR